MNLSSKANDGLPDGWKRARLGDISLEGPTYGANAKAIPLTGEAPRYVRITDIDESGFLKPEGAVAASSGGSKYDLREGDLLFARSGSVGRLLLFRKEYGRCIYAGYLIRFRVDQSIVLPEFVAAYAKTESYWSWIHAKKRTTSLSNINGKEYASMAFPLPPLAEQRRIVDVVERADAIRHLHEGAASKAGELLFSLISERLSPASRPAGWKRVHLRDVCTMDRRHCRGDDESLPALGMEQVEAHFGRINRTPGSKSVSKKSTTFLFDERHVLYGKLGPELNKVGLPFFAGQCSTELLPLLPSKRLKREFLALFLRRSETAARLTASATGARMPRTDLKILMGLELALPPLPEQERIVEIAGQAESLRVRHLEAQEKASELLASLVARLIPMA